MQTKKKDIFEMLNSAFSLGLLTHSDPTHFHPHIEVELHRN